MRIIILPILILIPLTIREQSGNGCFHGTLKLFGVTVYNFMYPRSKDYCTIGLEGRCDENWLLCNNENNTCLRSSEFSENKKWFERNFKKKFARSNSNLNIYNIYMYIRAFIILQYANRLSKNSNHINLRFTIRIRFNVWMKFFNYVHYYDTLTILKTISKDWWGPLRNRSRYDSILLSSN